MDKRYILAIVITVLIGIGLIILYLIHIDGGISNYAIDWGYFGSFIGGVLGPIVGVLAFIGLFYNLDLTKRQFQKQSEDQIFFKLIDNQKRLIENNSLEINKKTYHSYSIIKSLNQDITRNLNAQCVKLGRDLLCNQYKELGIVQFGKVFEVIKGPRYITSLESDRDDFIVTMDVLDKNERWEYVKGLIGSSNHEGLEMQGALRAIGSVYFYKIDFVERQYLYDLAMQKISSDFGDFLDSYIKGIEFILEFISNAMNKNNYISFLSSQLSVYEHLIIYYYLLSGKARRTFVLNVKEYIKLDNLSSVNGIIIDAPSQKEIEDEIRHVYKFYEIE